MTTICFYSPFHSSQVLYITRTLDVRGVEGEWVIMEGVFLRCSTVHLRKYSKWDLLQTTLIRKESEKFP